MPPKFTVLATLIMLGSFTSPAQNSKPVYVKTYSPKSTTIFYKLGETQLPIRVAQYGNVRDVVYINLHDDEQSSVEAARSLLKTEGGLLIKFENNHNRNIRFRLKGKYYTFDPNRMFSREGITQTLTHFRRISPDAIKEIEKLAQRILQFIPENPSCVIALHNNTEGRFGVNSYLSGEPISINAKKVFENPEQDPDDIFFTTDSILYQRLSRQKFNTIWQDNENARRDGSLSVYCGERNIRYVNCETQHGKTSQYFEMLLALTPHIERINPEALVYNFRFDADSNIAVAPDQEIYFGEEKIGLLKSVYRDDSLKISGRLEIDRRFTLYSNTDFFYFTSSGNHSRIEMRIDPTREKQLLNPLNSVISIIAKN